MYRRIRPRVKPSLENHSRDKLKIQLIFKRSKNQGHSRVDQIS